MKLKTLIFSGLNVGLDKLDVSKTFFLIEEEKK